MVRFLGGAKYFLFQTVLTGCGTWGLLRGLKVTTHCHPVQNLRSSGDIPPLPHMPSWRAQKKNLPLPYNNASEYCKVRRTLLEFF